jgi:hypothetical protein
MHAAAARRDAHEHGQLLQAYYSAYANENAAENKGGQEDGNAGKRDKDASATAHRPAGLRQVQFIGSSADTQQSAMRFKQRDP